MKAIRLPAFALLGLIATASTARAGFTPLPPGSTVVITAGSLNPYLVLASETHTVTTGPLAGTVVFSEVIAEKIPGSPHNVFDTSHLDFVYQVTPPASDIKGLKSVSVASFKGLTVSTAVEYLGPGNYKPVSATRTADGNTVSFGFTPTTKLPVQPYTELLVVHTNVGTKALGLGNATFGDLTTSGSLGHVFSPSAVPEPGTLLLGCVAIPGLAFCYIRNRRKTAPRNV